MQNAEPLGLRILRITPQAVCHNLIVTTSKRSHHLSVKIPTPKPRTNRLLTSPSLATQLFQNQDFSIPYKRQTTPKQPPSASSRTPLLYHANSPQKQRSAGLPCRRIGEAHKPPSKRIRPQDRHNDCFRVQSTGCAALFRRELAVYQVLCKYRLRELNGTVNRYEGTCKYALIATYSDSTFPF
jgi:hypothetical protein